MILSPPQHIKTPMGAWHFFDKIELEEGKKHDIQYEKVEGVEIIPFESVGDADKLFTLLPQDTLTEEHKKRLTGGLVIKITQPVMRPLFIKHFFAENSNWHTLIIVENGASAKIIETFNGKAGTISHAVEAFIGENSQLSYANTQTITGNVLTRKYATLTRDSTIDWFELNANTGMTYSRIETLLSAENANTTTRTLYLGNDAAKLDVGVKAQHTAPHTTSDLQTKGVLAGTAKAIYEGNLSIGEPAMKSDAFQKADTLLLNKDAEVKASPMLFIENEDVICSHAVTSGKLDAEKLFYLQARGLSEHDAQQLLITAFLWPIIELLPPHVQRAIEPLAVPIIKQFTEVYA